APEVLCDRGSEQILQLRETRSLMARQRRVALDDLSELVVELALVERGGENEVAQRAKCVFAGGAVSELAGQRFAQRLEVAEEHVFLAREVGEDRPGRDAGRVRDLKIGRAHV